MTGWSQPFIHPGGLHTLADLERMKTNVLAGNHPWIDDWNVLVTDSEAQSNYTAAPTADFGANRQRADADAHAAYLNTIRWYISGNTNYAECAVRICNAWSSTVTNNSDTGLSSLPTMSFALVGELLRIYPGWKAADFSAFTNMMSGILYPNCHNFLVNHLGTCSSYLTTSWDAPNMASVLGIGVLCDDTNKYNEAVAYFKSGIGNGCITNAIWMLQPGSLGQPQESGRDQEHCTLGIADLGVFCQVAWNQGLDLFGYDNNRLLAGVEYIARYNLWHDVPYSSYNNCVDDNWLYISENGHGRLDDRPVYEMFYNHYAVLKGLSAPNTKAMAQLYRPEHGSADHFGYGTLTYTLNAGVSPYPPAPVPPVPTGLAANAGISQVTLNWAPPAEDLVQGYKLFRATSSGGPYTNIAFLSASTQPDYTDNSVTVGNTYYYVVAAVNQCGASAYSAEARATPVAAGALPTGWTWQDVGVVGLTGNAVYSASGNNTFIVQGAGSDIGGTVDSFSYVYKTVTNNFELTARLANVSWVNVDKVGLVMRGSTNANAPCLAVVLGQTGARMADLGIRSGAGNSMTWQWGDQFTWVPVWFKLLRSGNTFTAYQSLDGITWYTMGSSTVNMASQYLVGLAVCSRNTNALNTTTFDNVSDVTTPLPSVPTGLTAAALSSTDIYLSWPSVTNASGYNLERSATNGAGYVVVARNVAATSYFDSTAVANTSYDYFVSAINGAGGSANSSPASVTTPALSPPAAPAGLSASTAATAQIELNWTASLGAMSYNVKRATTSGGPYTGIATGVVATFTDTNVVAGVTYYYVVSAVNSYGEGLNSSEVSAMPATSDLRAYLKFDASTGTTASDATGNGWNGTLINGPSWVAGYSNNAVSLNGGGQYVSLPTGIVTGVSNITIAAWVKVNSLANWARVFDFGSGTSAYMFLAPQNGATGTLRFAITTNSSGGEQQLNAPTALGTGAWHHVAVTLDNGVGLLYVDGIAVATNNSMTLNPSNLGNSPQNYIGKSQWNDPYLNGVVDEFRIYDGALSPGEVATLIAPLPAPNGLVATPGDGQITLNWNPVVNAAVYHVKRSLLPGGPYAAVATNILALAYTDSGLMNGTNYYYVVSAVNAVAESANSSAVAVRPVSSLPPQLSVNWSGGQFHFDWPADHLGWQLQFQTNATGVGLGTNWITVTNSSSTNEIDFPVVNGSGSGFFRLVLP